MEADVYKQIINPEISAIYKDKGSKFIAYAYNISSTEQVKEIIQTLKKEHFSARHYCYAYRIGKSEIQERANDDGEPSNSAGAPILGQISSKELTNTLVVVVRYFGGIKLGVGGLINAYKTAAKDILDLCQTEVKTIDMEIEISGEYQELNHAMRIIKEHNLQVTSQNMSLNFEIVITVRKRDFENIFEILSKMHKLNIKAL